MFNINPNICTIYSFIGCFLMNKSNGTFIYVKADSSNSISMALFPVKAL